MRANLKHDKKFNLGFLRNPRRLNVAISRARALLVVIGNMELLASDSHWLKFLQYCDSLGCYQGPSLHKEDSSPNEGEDEGIVPSFCCISFFSNHYLCIGDYMMDDEVMNVDAPWKLED